MKTFRDVCIAFVMNLVAICSVCFAGYLAINSAEGWGWFLFVAAITTVTRYRSDDKDDF